MVEKITAQIRTENPEFIVVKMDLFAAGSEEEFLENFSREVIKASSTKIEEWLENSKKLFQKLVPKFEFNIQPDSDFSISFDWKEARKNKEEILNLPETLATIKNKKVLVCIDEFQNLAQFQDFENIEKTMRSVWQKQKNVVYCLYGSKRSMMQDIFTNASKPFYKFGDIFWLQKIKTEKWTAFIKEGFRKTGRTIDDDFAEKIPVLMKNHSWYVQQFSFYIWAETEQKVTQEIFDKARQRVIEGNEPLFKNMAEGLSFGQINLIKAVLKGETQLSAKKTLEKYNLGTSASVNKNKQTLINKDILNQTDDGFELLDPVFELWFRKLYF
ncbi:MAG: ATP-binding protein [Bergeyella sp.]